MIGQQELKEQLHGVLPQFVILVGESGSGKKTLIKELFDGVYLESNSVESVRKLIELVYQLHDTVFIMPDADTMSLGAKNALLKVVEECPNNNKFIMTLEDDSHTLDTIRSRAVIYHMEEYTADEILEYYNETYSTEHDAEVLAVCENMGDVNLFMQMGGIQFYLYVQKVVENIAKVSGANAFKIADKIALKSDEQVNSDKYDLKLFWRAFSSICVLNYKDSTGYKRRNILKFAQGCQITGKYIRDLMISGLNKQMLFDRWILEIREEWMHYESNGTES